MWSEFSCPLVIAMGPRLFSAFFEPLWGWGDGWTDGWMLSSSFPLNKHFISLIPMAPRILIVWTVAQGALFPESPFSISQLPSPLIDVCRLGGI